MRIRNGTVTAGTLYSRVSIITVDYLWIQVPCIDRIIYYNTYIFNPLPFRSISQAESTRHQFCSNSLLESKHLRKKNRKFKNREFLNGNSYLKFKT
jgi:hypothetical protein